MRYAQEQISTALVLLKATGPPDRVVLVAEEIGYTPSLIYKWIREYREKGCFQPMKKTTANINVNPNDICGRYLYSGTLVNNHVYCNRLHSDWTTYFYKRAMNFFVLHVEWEI